jgi:HD-GYP domain-containing protein (c-di-GMP phosphodiesterase class II)
MLPREAQPKPQPLAPAEQATALAAGLREEFGTPFVLYDATTGVPLPGQQDEPDAAHRLTWEPSAVVRAAGAGQSFVALLADGRFQLVLPLAEAGKSFLLAVDAVAALGHTPTETAQEQIRLQKWVQSVADRLRLAHQLPRHRSDAGSEGQAGIAWETLLTFDQLLRRLRFHREPVKNQRRILQTAAAMLKIQALAWVPQQAESAIVLVGDPLLSPWDYRQLVAQLAQSPEAKNGLLLWNQIKDKAFCARFPQINNLMAFSFAEPGSAGWVIALNKQDASPFRRSDAALLTPFMGLLELHMRSWARYTEVKELLVGLTRSLTAAIDAKDSYTFGHSERVARIAVELGRELELAEDEVSDIYLAGLLHDIGKIGIRDSVLCKKEALTPEEYDHIKEHVLIGYRILSDLNPIRHLLPGVLYHHERFDGKGYPEGLKGEAIPLLARILAVADGYDAMSTARPYRMAMPGKQVEQILQDGAGTQWDQKLIEVFMRCRKKIHAIRQRGVGESLRSALDGALRTRDRLSGGSSLDFKPILTPPLER